MNRVYVVRIPSLPQAIPLNQYSLHIWKFSILTSPDAWSAAQPLLMPDELSHARRFSTTELRNSYAWCRACVKKILADCLPGRSPEKMVFSYGPFGKPLLDGIQFSISHSGSVCVLAVTDACTVGCDIQCMDNRLDEHSLVHFFHPEEQKLLASLGEEAFRQAFYRMWVRKEAVMKATGQGLRLGVKRVLTGLDGDCSLVEAGGQEPAAQWWTPCLEEENSCFMAVALPASCAKASIIRHDLTDGMGPLGS